MSYTPPTISNYNASPPSDDGSQTSSNRIYWSTIKNKLSDPIKNYIDSINSSVDAAFSGLFLSTIDDKAVNFTAGTGDDGKMFNCTSAITVTLPPAASATEGYHICIFNSSSGTITVDGDGSETINGAANVTLINQYEAVTVISTGAGWLAVYLPIPARMGVTGNLAVTGNVTATGSITATAALAVSGNSTAAGVITMAEDTDNGTNKVTLTAPQSIASDYTLTLPSTAGTLALSTDVDNSKPLLQATVATTSGTSVDLSTSIPSGVKRITINFVGVSTNGTSPYIIQVGNGSFVTTGYLSGNMNITSTPSPDYSSSTAGFQVNRSNGAASVVHGTMVLTLIDASTDEWNMITTVNDSGVSSVYTGAGYIDLTGDLDRIRITTVGGANTFDAGKVSIAWEY